MTISSSSGTTSFHSFSIVKSCTPGRDTFAWETTVKDQRARNVHIKDGISEDEFVAMRTTRDAKLSAPRLLLPSIQVNIRAGHFPTAEANGVRYLTIPVTFKRDAAP